MNRKWIGWIFSLLLCLIVAYGIAYSVTRFVAYETLVEGDSMGRVLPEGDSIIVEKMTYYFSKPQRYDVVVFPVTRTVMHQTITTDYVKRIIGLPGESVQIKKGKVYINGKILKSDVYGEGKIADPGDAIRPLTLGKGEYFLLGDNRNASTDSRSKEIGLVTQKEMKGKVWGSIWPLSHFGRIKEKR